MMGIKKKGIFDAESQYLKSSEFYKELCCEGHNVAIKWTSCDLLVLTF